MRKKPRHPRFAFWLTAVSAILASFIAIYHLITVALMLADPTYTDMLSGFSGSLYQIFDYFVVCLPVNILLLVAALLNFCYSHALTRLWSFSALASVSVFLICGILILIGVNSGPLTVSLLLASRAIFQSLTAVTLTHSLTLSYLNKRKQASNE